MIMSVALLTASAGCQFHVILIRCVSVAFFSRCILLLPFAAFPSVDLSHLARFFNFFCDCLTHETHLFSSFNIGSILWACMRQCCNERNNVVNMCLFNRKAAQSLTQTKQENFSKHVYINRQLMLTTICICSAYSVSIQVRFSCKMNRSEQSGV